MGWWSSSSSTSAEAAAEAHVQDAHNAIASIFAPGNRTVTSTTANDTNEKRLPGLKRGITSSAVEASLPSDVSGGSLYIELPSSTWRGLTNQMRAWLPHASAASSNSSEEAGAALNSSPSSSSTAATPSTAGGAAAPPSWDQLPPSPVAGYELTKRGLVDRLRTPPHTLTTAELKDLLSELTAVEQKAKYDVDRHFAGHLGSRGLHGLELLVNPCLFLTGLYLMSWKTVQLYNGAVPQDSLVFTKLLALLRRRLPAGQREQLAQRHRRLMRATNARVALTFLTGVGVFSLAWVSRPSPNVMEDAPDMQTAKEMVAYQRHAEASVKWCWYVYYHHPAYRGSTNA